MRTILITGAAGFIGRELCSRLSSNSKVVGTDITKKHIALANIDWEMADLRDLNSATAICGQYCPDVIIHCAGIAHQKMGAIDSATYMKVNSEVTENLVKVAGKINPGLSFIFLSSVSVYGEENISIPVFEENECHPSSDYAVSKLDAERRLIALFNEGVINNLIILRLAPVYDSEWALNLDRRVFAPKKLAYLRFGSGKQKMSALARPNLVNLIEFLLQKLIQNSEVTILNVCDAEAYDFNTIIRVFHKSRLYPHRVIIPVPLSAVRVATRIGGFLFTNKKRWFHSSYYKLASDLVFDAGKMRGTGFSPAHFLETVFDKDIEK